MAMLLSILVICIIICVVLVGLYLLHVHRCYSRFQSFGIGGPPPIFFWGNIPELILRKRLSLCIQHWTNQYGSIYVYFEGHTPILVVSDPNLVNEIFTKNFSKFHSRRQFPLEDRRTQKGIHLFSSTGDQWRRQRSIINPTFSHVKIKRMIPMINDCITNLLIKLQEFDSQQTDGFDIYKLYKCLTMELIWRCCFGVNIDMQNEPNHPYLKRSEDVFARENSTHLATLLSVFIPELQSFWLTGHYFLNKLKAKLRSRLPLGERFLGDDPSEWLKENVDCFIQQAQISKTRKNDFNANIINTMDLIHLMLDSLENTANNTSQSDNSERTLSLNEIKQNIYLFMVAGYETTSTALAYITYVLSTHMNEQNKLRNHIQSFMNKDDLLDYDTINKMVYLDWFIKEVLRMYPIAPIVINRECSEPIDIPGLGHVSPGVKTTIDIYSLHYNDDLWGPVDTKQFYPERFATKRHPVAFAAFGLGPRHCIGMQFALVALKIATIRLLQNYTILPATTDLNLVELVTISPEKVLIRLKRELDSV